MADRRFHNGHIQVLDLFVLIHLEHTHGVQLKPTAAATRRTGAAACSTPQIRHSTTGVSMYLFE